MSILLQTCQSKLPFVLCRFCPSFLSSYHCCHFLSLGIAQLVKQRVGQNMARQQEHSAPPGTQIIPGTIEETCESILRRKLHNEEDFPDIVDQLKSMLVRRSEFECVQAKVETLEVGVKTLQADSEKLTKEHQTLQADLETRMKERRGISTRDFVHGVIRQTSGVDQRELVLEPGT